MFSVDNLGHPLGQAYSHYRILEMTPRKILYIGDFMKNGPQLWSFFEIFDSIITKFVRCTCKLICVISLSKEWNGQL